MSGQSEQGVEQTAQPTLCSAGCGFYSNSGAGGMCSKCSREAQAREEKLKAATSSMVEAANKQAQALAGPTLSVPQAPAPVPAPTPSASAGPAAAEPSPSSTSGAPAPPKPSSTRCLMCNKRVGLTGFNCKCNPDAVFCSSHRYAEAHACTFDYKAAQMKQLAENNPVVMAAKLNKF